jgi:PAS domain S-box-containing protein
VTLAPLVFHHISSLIADTLHHEKSEVLPLADLVVCKTNGNPFFVNQFLTTLFQKKLLSLDSKAGRWKWELSEIKALDITDNVVDLLIHRLEQMRPDTQHVLRMAACMGNSFDLRTLGLVIHEPISNILESLFPAMEDDLIVSTSGFRVPREVQSDDPILLEVFRFRHDRVQQAAYALIEKKDREKVHLQIGRLLMERNETGDLEEELFDIINHLNLGAHLIELQGERNELAALNLRAARKARGSAAFELALDYLNAGIRLLNEDSWEVQYDLTLELYAECVEAARIMGHFLLMEELSAVVTENARTSLDQVSVFKSRIQRCMAENELSVALNTAFEMLNKLGEEIPKYSTPAHIERILDATMASLGERKIEELINLPEMTDPFKLAAMSILATVTSAAYIGAPELFPLIVCKGVNLSVAYGNTSDSAVAYVAFGVILCKKGEDIPSGYRFGRLSLNLVKRFNAREHEAKVNHVASCYITHWKKHVLETLGSALKGYYSGLETGDLEFAGYGVYCHGKHAFFAGRPLPEVESEMVRYGEAIKKLKQETPARYNDIFHQAVLNLLGKSADPTILEGDAYKETTMVPRHQKANDRLAIMFVHFSKLVLCYLFENYAQAIENANLAESEISRAAGGPLAVSLFHFYDSLAKLAAYSDCPPSVQKACLLKVAANQKKLRAWATHAPMNHSHKFHMVEAELSRVLGNDLHALEHYNQAIMLAGENGYINEEALANELAAKYWLDRSKKALAAPLMQRAHDCYTLWGARGKILQIEKKYPQLLSRKVNDTGSSSLSHAPLERALEFGSSQGLDLSTMTKASQAISREIMLNKLLTTLMRIVIENAGAERGALILKVKGNLFLTALGTADGEFSAMDPFVPLEERDDLSQAIANYVVRTREILLLKDAVAAGLFAKDPYIQECRPRSVLCMPILLKSRLMGVLYLENRLVSGVFSPERLELLRLLVSQTAISIENARLYDNLRKAEEKYRSIFENAVEGIYQTTQEGRFVSANPAMARILGYDSVDELMRSITEIGKQLYVSRKARNEFIAQVREKRKVSGFEVQYYHKDGSKIWASLHARAVYNENGTLNLIEGIFSDITEQKRQTMILREREETLRKENLTLKSQIKDRYRFHNIIGKSPRMQEVYELILKASTADVNVIIYGESGTGKELVARAIHRMSDRKDAPFVPVNCSAIPENLLESEFFGYRKGAFTGAIMDKMGHFDLAERGTLFLDELGEIDQNTQVKLLRVLEGGGFTPVGGRKVRKPNVRIIAATNKNLQERVKKGQMREDFFYRIHIIPIHLPPLRDRKEDIPLLIEHFMKLYSENDSPALISGNILEAFQNHEWPGNIRELQNTLHRYITLNTLDIFKEPMPAPPQSADDSEAISFQGDDVYKIAMADFERRLFKTALEKNRWHRERAAQSLGIPRRTFFRKLGKMGLFKHDSRQ